MRSQRFGNAGSEAGKTETTRMRLRGGNCSAGEAPPPAAPRTLQRRPGCGVLTPGPTPPASFPLATRSKTLAAAELPRGPRLFGAPVLRGHKLVYLSRAALETRYAPAAMLRCRGC